MNVAVLPPVSRRWWDLRQLELPQTLRDAFTFVTLRGDSRPGFFEGSHYEEIISHISSHSLQEEYLSPEDVEEIHQDLKEYLKINRGDKKILNLEKFFRACSENHLGLVRAD